MKTILEEFSLGPALFTKAEFRLVEPMSGAKPHRFPPPVDLRHTDRSLTGLLARQLVALVP